MLLRGGVLCWIDIFPLALCVWCLDTWSHTIFWFMSIFLFWSHINEEPRPAQQAHTVIPSLTLHLQIMTLVKLAQSPPGNHLYTHTGRYNLSTHVGICKPERCFPLSWEFPLLAHWHFWKSFIAGWFILWIPGCLAALFLYIHYMLLASKVLATVATSKNGLQIFSNATWEWQSNIQLETTVPDKPNWIPINLINYQKSPILSNTKTRLKAKWREKRLRLSQDLYVQVFKKVC